MRSHRFGEGMQWHSDGADGEATMLLSFDGITEDMGVLKLVPRSYMEYVSGVGYDEVRKGPLQFLKLQPSPFHFHF